MNYPPLFSNASHSQPSNLFNRDQVIQSQKLKEMYKKNLSKLNDLRNAFSVCYFGLTY